VQPLSEPSDPTTLAAARESRRWLIGVSISVVFGLFGVVMALLGYLEGTRPTAPSGANVPEKRDRDPVPARRDHRLADRHR